MYIYIGNVYVKYESEDAAQKCVDNINGRMYNNNPVHAELTIVTDFRDGRCRKFDEGLN